MNTVTLIRSEIQKFSDDVLAEAIGQAIGELMRERDARITALEAKLAALVFKGAWTEGRRYCERNLVSMGGAVYFCRTDNTDARPGVGTTDWTLLVPKARDGRDFTPPEPPEQRVARSARSSSSEPLRTVRDNR
jgi:hypothetical protein